MATERNSSRDRQSRRENPYIHIPFDLHDLSGLEVTGGGAKELVPVDAAYRAGLIASLNETMAAMTPTLTEYPELPGVLVLKLRETGIAKSHRPVGLIVEAETPPTGHASMNEVLVSVNAVTLQQLRNVIARRNTRQIRANLSAVESFSSWDIVRRLPSEAGSLDDEARRHFCVHLVAFSSAFFATQMSLRIGVALSTFEQYSIPMPWSIRN